MNKEEIRQLFRDNYQEPKDPKDPKTVYDDYVVKLDSILKDKENITKPLFQGNRFNLNPFNHKPLSLGQHYYKQLSLQHRINEELIKCAVEHRVSFSLDSSFVWDKLHDNKHTILDYYIEATPKINSDRTLRLSKNLLNKTYYSVGTYLMSCGTNSNHEVYWTIDLDDTRIQYTFNVGPYYLGDSKEDN